MQKVIALREILYEKADICGFRISISLLVSIERRSFAVHESGDEGEYCDLTIPYSQNKFIQIFPIL